MSDTKQNHQGLDPEVAEKLQKQASDLAENVNAGNYAKAMTLINELSEVRDQSLYREVGRLTRSLHEAIRNFQIDPRNAEQKEVLSKMSDASDRLAYVVQMTNGDVRAKMKCASQQHQSRAGYCAITYDITDPSLRHH